MSKSLKPRFFVTLHPISPFHLSVTVLFSLGSPLIKWEQFTFITLSRQCQDYHQHHGTSSTLLHSLSSRPPTLKSRRNAAAPLGAVGPSVTAQSLVPATFAHTLANSSRFVETLPVIERRGRRRIIAVSNGVFVNAIDRGGKRNDKRGVELDLSLDLGSRDRLGGCIGSLLLITRLLSLLSLLEPAALSMGFCVSRYSGVGTRRRGQSYVLIVGGGIRAYAFTDHIHERETGYP
ncbi:hypothetical protein BU17DRAFT_70621 [Hysterangium stoloniferum]|nr:hypothetical protein BU17DRAFT_70621 [Hysterangium stoloniferum]